MTSIINNNQKKSPIIIIIMATICFFLINIIGAIAPGLLIILLVCYTLVGCIIMAKQKKEIRDFNEKYPDYNRQTIEKAKLKINKSEKQVQSDISTSESGRTQSSTAFCPYCGERVPAGSKTCHGCGRKIDD